MKPLSNNPQHLRQLCAMLALSQPLQPLLPVSGGFHHRMWKLQTADGFFAVKQLNPETDVHSPAVIRHYNTAESIAAAFSLQGIGAIHALQGTVGYLQVIEHTGYLIYPWSHAKALPRGTVSASHALQVASLLARMHQAQIQIPDIAEPSVERLENEAIEQLIATAGTAGVHQAKALQQALPALLAINRVQADAIPLLTRHRVVSHGDLDQKNILWQSPDKPLIIDWESARKLNPTYEIMLAALDWGGILGHFNIGIYQQVLSTYQRCGGRVESDVPEAAYHGILGEWLSWLVYNIGRAIDADAEQRQLGNSQIELVLPTLLRLKRLEKQLCSTALKPLPKNTD